MTEYIPPFDDDSNDADDAVYQTEFDPITDRVSEELIKAVATLNDADPTELTVLSEFVDPEALDALFGPERVRTRVIRMDIFYSITIRTT